MYLKLKNNIIEKYPYSIPELRADNPQVSFPQTMTDSLLSEWGVYPVKFVEAPEVDHTKEIIEKTPVYENGEWVQSWEIVNVSSDILLQKILKLRANNYPPMSDYLDGIVKGDQAQVDKYIADCLAVKAKYPKP